MRAPRRDVRGWRTAKLCVLCGNRWVNPRTAFRASREASHQDRLRPVSGHASQCLVPGVGELSGAGMPFAKAALYCDSDSEARSEVAYSLGAVNQSLGGNPISRKGAKYATVAQK